MTSDPVAVVERARAAIARYDRPDLDARLAAAHARLLDDRTRVLVVGEFKQGKSLLVNGLVGRARLPDVRRRRHGRADRRAARRGAGHRAGPARRRAGRRSRATSSPTTSASRATPATGRGGATPRSGCPGPS